VTREEIEKSAIEYLRQPIRLVDAPTMETMITDFAIEQVNAALEEAIEKVQYTGGNSEEINVSMIHALKIK
jgi:hypothetical protein